MNSSLPVASLESIYGRRQYKAFLEQYAVDVAIVDVPWNDDLVTHPPMRARQEILVIISGCPRQEPASRYFYTGTSTYQSRPPCLRNR